jgi:4-hydroxy-tetrahydrodipicolinate synthase
MKKILFTGCGTAIATPFNENGVNLEEFKRLVEFQINEGVDAIIVCGTTGEASTMTEEEKIATIKCAVETSNGRIPIIAGTGGNNTVQAIKMSKIAESLGVDGLLVVTPYYNKTTQSGLVEHYKAIASEVSLPIIIYNVPGRTGLNILPTTCLELSKIENIVAIKEASGNLSQVAEIAHLCGDNLTIYSGNDDQILPVLSLGGKGVISVLSNIEPKLTHNMVQLFMEGNIEEAINLQLKSIPLIKALFSEVNPIPVKEALNIIGYDYGVPRLPLVKMSDSASQKLKEEIYKIKK